MMLAARLAVPHFNILTFPLGGAQQALDRVGLKERIARMFGGAFQAPFEAAFVEEEEAPPNPLAAVPWVAQWKFNNNGNDSVGSNTLTNNNAATFTTGKLGGATGATQLNAASNRYWSISDNAAISMGTGVKWLIAAWLYPDSFPAAGNTILVKGSGSGPEYFIDATNAGVLRVATQVGMMISNGGTLTTGAWQLIMVWFDGTTYHASINNAGEVTGGSGSTVDDTGALWIGNRQDATTGFCWDGRIDNLCISKSASSFVTQEILDALYNSGAGTETLT